MNLRTFAIFKKREMSQVLKALFAGKGKTVIRFQGEVVRSALGDERRQRRRVDVGLALDPIGAVKRSPK